MKLIAVLSFVLLATAPGYAPSAAAETVDVALVLAGDVSGSMSNSLQAQREGFEAAFRNPEIAAAIGSGALGRVAITYVEWASPNEQWVVVPWTVIADSDDAAAFAQRLEAAPPERGNLTSISAGLLFAAHQFAVSNVTAMRRAIDVSGDGPNSAGPPIAAVRNLVVAAGITVNGLPFVVPVDHGRFAYLTERPTIDLQTYFQDCVIGGPGAFAMPMSGPSQYFFAIRRKLVLEIASMPAKLMPAGFVPSAPSQECLEDGSAFP